VIDAKYHWHLPLYRQAQMLATHGIALDRSTLAFWVGYAAQELKPLWHRLRQLLLASSKLCVDETPAPVLDPGRGRTKYENCVTPIERTASPTDLPCESKTSTWRSFATISSALCFFWGIPTSSLGHGPINGFRFDEMRDSISGGGRIEWLVLI
jgi:hypothetical protein